MKQGEVKFLTVLIIAMAVGGCLTQQLSPTTVPSALATMDDLIDRPFSATASLQELTPTTAVSVVPATASPTATVPELSPTVVPSAILTVAVLTERPLLATVYAQATLQVILTPPSGRTTQAAQASSIAINLAALSSTKVAAGTGYLWWLNDRRATVMVIAQAHQEPPYDDLVAQQWAARGEVCFAEAGAPYVIDQAVPAPAIGLGLEVTAGKCQGYKGWAWAVAAHVERP